MSAKSKYKAFRCSYTRKSRTQPKQPKGMHTLIKDRIVQALRNAGNVRYMISRYLHPRHERVRLLNTYSLKQH